MADARSRRPRGQVTRGKTARNRLRGLDNLIVTYDGGLIRRTDGEYSSALVVDLGYGAEPTTTLECASRLRRLNPTLPVLGVEIDVGRVEAAKPHEDELTMFRLGGFDLPLRPHERVRLIRALNVLREYDESAVVEAHQTLGSYLLPGGLLVEGTSDPFGRIWVVNLVRKTAATGLEVEGLVFGTNFRWGFRPELFQPVLPKNHIHRVRPGQPIGDFMDAWKRAYRESRPYEALGLRQQFTATALRLSELGYSIDTRRKLLARGFVVWRPG